MRRKDREVTNKEEIFEILQRCETIRIAMQGENYPYCVPVSFGLEIKEGVVTLYFHCAKMGLKVETLSKNPHVCVEADQMIRVEKTRYGITARYESVIGFGTCSFIDSEEELKYALKKVVDHYGYEDYSIDDCASLSHVLAGKIVLEEVTGKRNHPEELSSKNN